MKNVKYTKYAIITFYLLASYWVTCLVFEKGFAEHGLQHTADGSHYENTLMIMLIATGFSAIGVFLLGLLSMFTYWIFVKLIFADEIKEAAMLYLMRKHKQVRNDIKNKQNQGDEVTKESPDHTIYE